MRLAYLPYLLVLFLVGCGGASDLDNLQGTWVQAPVPRNWTESAPDEKDYERYLAAFSKDATAGETTVLVFKGNSLAELTGNETITRTFAVKERNADGSFYLEFSSDGQSGQCAHCRFRDGLLEYVPVDWRLDSQKGVVVYEIPEKYQSVRSAVYQRTDK